MKKIKFYPLLLFVFVAAFAVSCKETKEDDFCQAFSAIIDINPSCEIPSVCCPVDEGNCYYLSPDGKKYSCDASQASSTNPDGCNLAQEKYIEENCETTKMSAANRESIKLELTALTRQMMLKARNFSLCN